MRHGVALGGRRTRAAGGYGFQCRVCFILRECGWKGGGASLGEKKCVRDVRVRAVYIVEEVCVKRDVAVGGELETGIHFRKKELLFSIV